MNFKIFFYCFIFCLVSYTQFFIVLNVFISIVPIIPFTLNVFSQILVADVITGFLTVLEISALLWIDNYWVLHREPKIFVALFTCTRTFSCTFLQLVISTSKYLLYRQMNKQMFGVLQIFLSLFVL